MLKTRITELFDITHPIIQGGMHYVGFAEMAAPVSNAGGLGIITGLTQKSPVDLANEIAKCHKLTDKPFGVNLTFLPGFVEPDYPGYIKAIVEGGVKIVETAGRSPEKYMESLKSAGIKVIHKCTSVRHSLKAEKIGCDAASVDGFECGGHPGEDDIPNMILLPRAAEELKIPFVASGGIGNGQQLVAALALGADGINMGTRFIATKEAPVHQNVKDAILDASELDTKLIMRSLKNTERVLSNVAVDRILQKEKDLGDNIKIQDIMDEVWLNKSSLIVVVVITLFSVITVSIAPLFESFWDIPYAVEILIFLGLFTIIPVMIFYIIIFLRVRKKVTQRSK